MPSINHTVTLDVRAHNAVLDALEHMVDAKGLRYVVETLAEVCSAKSDHIVENWQDRPLAAKWDRQAVKLLKCAEALKKDITF